MDLFIPCKVLFRIKLKLSYLISSPVGLFFSQEPTQQKNRLIELHRASNFPLVFENLPMELATMDGTNCNFVPPFLSLMRPIGFLKRTAPIRSMRVEVPQLYPKSRTLPYEDLMKWKRAVHWS